MTYNIRHGGRPDRADAILAVLAGQRPDLLALQELWRPQVPWLAARLGMRAVLGRSLFGQPVALLARAGLRVREQGPIRRPFHHAAVRLVLETTRGPLTALAAHLYPASGGRRLREARWLAGRIDRTGLTLLLGDLNGLDPHTDHDERLAALSPAHRARHLHGGRADTRAVAALESAGLVDVFRRVGSGRDHTAPTQGPGGAEFSRLRLDYVLATEALARTARSCHVIDEGAAATASDHYPVVAEFDVGPLTFADGTHPGKSAP
jgi:exodeoxyribonuclease-3